MKKIHIISGGTIAHIATHLALSSPAYGKTGCELLNLSAELMPELDVYLHQTKMAGSSLTTMTAAYGLESHPRNLETNNDVLDLVNELVADPDTKIIFMPVALCDFYATDISADDNSQWEWIQRAEDGGRRLKTSHGEHMIQILPAPKIIPLIRAKRKDIFLVGFKTTDGATEDEQYIAGLGLLKGSSCNLVLANDVKTRVNMVITPEEARYHVTKDRQVALTGLVEMAKLRSHLTFTRSTVVAGTPVPWESDLVPEALREVVDHLILQGAYKPFRGATVGHFACRLSEDTFLTSQRKTNFNDLAKLGLVMVKTDGPDTVLAYGAKPSVGGQSQRILFNDHPEYDCVVHAHVPLKPHIHDADGYYVSHTHDIPTVSQREFECGSMQCGQNTSNGMKEFVLPGGTRIACVMLDQHGPNILFNSKNVDAKEVIAFIDANFDLTNKTGGYVS